MDLKKISIVILLFLTNNIFSQKTDLGKVTIEELKEKQHPKDTSAVAAYIFNKGRTYFQYSQDDGFSVITDVEAKIKIYKKEGYDWANKSVKFYVGSSSKENVIFNKAATYNMVNGAIEKSKLKSDGEFTEKANKYWSIKKITMPNVKEGSIIEYSYTIKSPFFSSLIDWDFQKSIPVNFSEYRTEIPEYYIYNPFFKGSLNPKIVKNNVLKTITLNHKERIDATLRYNGGGTKSYSENVSFSENQSTYTFENIPAIKDEGFVNNIDNYTSSVSNELVSIQMPQQPYKHFATSWEDVSKKIYENDEFGPQLNKNGYYEDDVKILLQGLSTPEEKTATLFNFVKSKMNRNKFYSIYTDDGVKKAYQEKTGNSAEINLMLVSMLRFAGLDANPILVSTRSNGIAIFPSRTAFNTVIAGVKNGGSIILMDATNKNSLPNILPNQDLNWFGRMIMKDGNSEMIDLMPKDNSLDAVTILAKIDNQGRVTGQVREQYLDYYALDFRDNYSSLSNDSYLEKVEKRHKGLEIENYERLNDKEFSEPIIEKYLIKNSNDVEVIGGKLYFSPMLHFAMKDNPFKQDYREYPVDFGFPTKDKYSISITIPEGYQVETLPTQVALSMPDNYGSFKYIITSTDTMVQIAVNLDINAAIFSPDDYSTLKEFFKKVVEKENEKVVLKKI